MSSKPIHPEIHPDNNDAYWNSMRSHDYSSSFSAASHFIRQNGVKKRGFVKRKNAATWVLLLLLPVLFFFSCQRSTYIEPQGATLSFTASDSLINRIDFALQQYADKEWKAVFRPRGGTMRGVISTSADQYEKLKALAEELKIIPGVTELYLSAVKTTVKESPLSRLSYRFFHWHFNAVATGDELLQATMIAKLKETSQPAQQLQLVMENGRKQVNLNPGSGVHNFSIAFTLPDGSYVTAAAEKWQ